MTRNLALFFFALNALLFTACSEDDDPIIDTPEVQDNELNGQLTNDVTLNPAVEYKLTGSYEVLPGATLTIPAGTRIIAEKGTDVYIAVHRDADIIVGGTETNPVVMTSLNNRPGDWGGLVLLGKGVTTEGVDVTAEVGGFQYGGTDNADSSGSIEYLLIEGAGAVIQAESQYNGLTLYAVGSGTRIENVAIRNGADDGIEFFGGAVSASNLYLENNEDDSVDWTEGWNGTLSNVYVLHTIEGFSTAIEADGVNNNPSIVNFTAISTTGGTALQFKKESGATINNLYLEGYSTSIDMKDGGAPGNVQINDADADDDAAYDKGTKVDISTWDWISAGA